MSENIIIVNKPVGMTSHDVVDRVRRATGERRVGHAGTLDPLASGVLIVLITREMTKRQAEFMGLPKEYKAEVTFGSVSNTYDAEGPVKQTATLEELRSLTQKDIETVLKQFVGAITQRPPAHSAIKQGGQPLYKKARQGTLRQEDIPERTVQIDAIELTQFVPATPPFPPTARMTIQCQKGVYIRSLAHDIGQALGCGAYLSELVRTKIGQYTIANAIPIEELNIKEYT